MINKFFLLLLIFLFSCVNPFAPKLTKENLQSSSFLTEQKSPQDVLTNFKYAYVFQDSLIYSELLDSSFIFISKNYSTTPPSVLTFYRDDDLRTTAKMFRHFEDINLTWGQPLISNIDSTSAEIRLSFSLTFDNGKDIPTLKGIAIFNFVKKKSEIWKIIRWEEI